MRIRGEFFNTVSNMVPMDSPHPRKRIISVMRLLIKVSTLIGIVQELGDDLTP
jgi:hypothetical protein